MTWNIRQAPKITGAPAVGGRGGGLRGGRRLPLRGGGGGPAGGSGAPNPPPPAPRGETRRAPNPPPAKGSKQPRGRGRAAGPL